MSKPLANNFSWSVSRGRLFRTCRRAYYYNYYGAWGGWESSAPMLARQLYVLKQIQNLTLWGGSLVHSVIADALKSRRSDDGAFPGVDELQKSAVARLRQGWLESARKEWRQSPKYKLNLFERFYGDGQSVDREMTDALKAKVLDAVENFRHSDTMAEALALPLRKWVSVEALDQFTCGEIPAGENGGAAFPVPVWCAIDFAYMDGDGRLHIVDWKTGSEHKDELRLQLACYALYAMGKWQLPLERLVLQGVFLNDGGRSSIYEINSESLLAAKDQMLNSARAMRELLDDAEANTASEANFPCSAGSPSVCQSCPFLKLCPRNNSDATQPFEAQ